MRAIVLLPFCLFLEQELAGSAAQAAMESDRRASLVRLCASSSSLDIVAAKQLRAELTQSSPMDEKHSMEVAEALLEAEKVCVADLDMSDTQFLGTLYVLLGNQLLAGKQYLSAAQTFEAADRLFKRRAEPSLMWLEAVRGIARVGIELQDFETAADAASKQTHLARSWVSKRGFVRDALVTSLRFEAETRAAAGQSETALQLENEANELESRH